MGSRFADAPHPPGPASKRSFPESRALSTSNFPAAQTGLATA
jgi:hypothetical protein